MWLKKAMVYLGLDDDEYQDYEPDTGVEPERSRDRQPPRHAGAVAASPPPEDLEPSGIGSVRPISPRASGFEGPGTSVPGQTVNPTSIASKPRPQVVRPIPATPNAKPHVFIPESFNEAQAVADKYKSDQPVVMNLQDTDRELARRLIDFASGLCYGLGGQMERIANQVYLLCPSKVEVSAEERRRLSERGYHA